jgi:hypothetical protein
MRHFAAVLAQIKAGAQVNGNAALQIGERKGGAPVSAVGRAEQRKERLVLIDRQELAVA